MFVMFRINSPRPSLLSYSHDGVISSPLHKPMDLKQLKQRAAAIPPIVSHCVCVSCACKASLFVSLIWVVLLRVVLFKPSLESVHGTRVSVISEQSSSGSPTYTYRHTYTHTVSPAIYLYIRVSLQAPY